MTEPLKFVVDWIPLEKEWPTMHQHVWVVCKNGKVFRDTRTNDTYHDTAERLKWSNAGHLGFQDIAEYHKYDWGIVTHWAAYIEPLSPDAPKIYHAPTPAEGCPHTGHFIVEHMPLPTAPAEEE